MLGWREASNAPVCLVWLVGWLLIGVQPSLCLVWCVGVGGGRPPHLWLFGVVGPLVVCVVVDWVATGLVVGSFGLLGVQLTG